MDLSPLDSRKGDSKRKEDSKSTPFMTYFWLELQGMVTLDFSQPNLHGTLPNSALLLWYIVYLFQVHIWEQGSKERIWELFNLKGCLSVFKTGREMGILGFVLKEVLELQCSAEHPMCSVELLNTGLNIENKSAS